MDAMAKVMESKERKAAEHGAPEERPREKKNPRAVFPRNQKTWIFY
jgi:hypothetical protein